MSFSLYAIHLPVGIFILVCLGAISPVARDLHGLGVFAFTIVSTIAVAVLFYLAFERHTPKIRKRLSAYCERFRGQAFRPA